MSSENAKLNLIADKDAGEGDEDTAIFDVNDMESMGEENMEDARAKANLCEVHDETEAARLAANVADGINRVAVTCAYASCTPGIDEDMRVTLETLAKQSKMMLVEAVSVCHYMNVAAAKVDASEVVSRLEAIEDQLADAITDVDAWGDVDKDRPFYSVISAKNGILDLIRDIEAESDGDAR